MRFSTVLAFVSLVAATPALATNLIGQSATATFDSFAATSTTQFVSPAVVGGGVEFSGGFDDVFSQVWVLNLDLGANTVTLSIDELTRSGFGNISSSASLLNINLSGLTGLLPVTLTGYSCTAACDGSVLGLSSTSTDASFGFDHLYAGETYVFTFGTVPEPASWALLITGFGLTGAAMRRRRIAVAA